jgi:hypothetical protein
MRWVTTPTAASSPQPSWGREGDPPKHTARGLLAPPWGLWLQGQALCECGWFSLNESQVVWGSQQRPDHNNQRLVIYHNHIQNHKHQSGLKFIYHCIALYESLSGFTMAQLALQSQLHQIAGAKNPTTQAPRKHQVQPRSQTHRQGRQLPSLQHHSFHFPLELIFNYTWVLKLTVIDGCKIF